MSNKAAYHEFCLQTEDLPLFFQDWWLDIVCQSGRWDVIMTKDKQDNYTAVFPFFIERKYGMDLIKMPPLSPYLGPWIKPATHLEKTHSKYSYERKIVKQLFEQLPKYWYLNLLLHPNFKQIMPLKWKGFKQTNELTYVLKDISDLDKIYNAFSSTARNKINKAEKSLRVEQSDDFEILWHLQKKTFDKQNIEMPFSRSFLESINQALKERGLCDLLIAYDKDDNPLAANYIVYDNSCAYNLMAGAEPEQLNSGAVSLIIWKAIQKASKRVDVFDFEGGMFENIESFFRSFGAEQVLYSRIIKTRNKALEFFLLLSNRI